MLSAVWSQVCVKAAISFLQSIPRLTYGDKELVPLSSANCTLYTVVTHSGIYSVMVSVEQLRQVTP